jgi:hypothetical protein
VLILSRFVSEFVNMGECFLSFLVTLSRRIWF